MIEKTEVVKIGEKYIETIYVYLIEKNHDDYSEFFKRMLEIDKNEIYKIQLEASTIIDTYYEVFRSYLTLYNEEKFRDDEFILFIDFNRVNNDFEVDFIIYSDAEVQEISNVFYLMNKERFNNRVSELYTDEIKKSGREIRFWLSVDEMLLGYFENCLDHFSAVYELDRNKFIIYNHFNITYNDGKINIQIKKVMRK